MKAINKFKTLKKAINEFKANMKFKARDILGSNAYEITWLLIPC